MSSDPSLEKILDELLASDDEDKLSTFVLRHPQLLTAAVDAPLAALADRAQRDGEEGRLLMVNMLGDLLRTARELGPQAAAAAFAGGAAIPAPADPALEYWSAFRRSGDPVYLDAALERWEADLARVAGGAEHAAALTNMAGGLASRFRITQDPADLERAVATGREAVELTASGAPERPSRLANLASALMLRHEALGDEDALDGALAALEEALSCAGAQDADDEALAVTLFNYVGALYARYRRASSPADLAAMIDAANRAVQLSSPGTRARSERLDALATALERRFLDEGDGASLDDAIARWREAAAAGPVGAQVLFAYGRALWRRWRLREADEDRRAALDVLGAAYVYGEDLAAELVTDLRRASPEPPPGELPPDLEALLRRTTAATVEFDREAQPAALTAALRGWQIMLGHPVLDREDSPLRPAALNDAGSVLWRRFTAFGSADDLQAAIGLFDEAARRSPAGSPQAGARLSNLAMALSARYRRTGASADLRAAVETAERAAGDPSIDPADLPAACNSLAEALLLRHRAAAEAEDVERAVELLERGIAAAPAGSEDLPALHGNLAKALERRDAPGDRDRALAAYDRALAVVRPGSPAWATLAGDRAMAQLGAGAATAQELERAVLSVEQAVDAAGGEPERLAHMLEQLGVLRLYRSSFSASASEAERSAATLTAAVGHTPEGSPEHARRLALLGGAQLTIARRSGRDADLDEAIATLRKAAARVAPGSSSAAVTHSTLSAALRRRFEARGASEDLDAAIAAGAAAADGADVDATSQALALLARFDRDAGRADLDAAIALLDGAVAACADAPARAGALVNLGTALLRRARLTEDPAEAERAVGLLREAARLGIDDHPQTALDAARTWAGWAAAQHRWRDAAEPYRLGLRAAAAVLREQAAREDTLAALRETRGFAAQAALALALAGDAEGAVVAMERSRALLLTDVLERERSDVARLREAGHEELASRYEQAAQQLGGIEAQLVAAPVLAAEAGPARGRAVDLVRMTRRTLDETVAAIRAVEGFEGFQQAAEYFDVSAFAGGTPLVYVAAGGELGVAVMVGPQGPVTLVLPALREHELRARADAYLAAYAGRGSQPAAWRAALETTGRWLWDAVAGPLVDLLRGELGLLVRGGARPAEPIALLVVALGPLALLPLQAAWTPAAEAAGGRRHAVDELLMTFTPNARAAFEARRRAARSALDTLLVVDEPQPVAAQPLSTASEVRAARAAFPGARVLPGSQATRERILDSLGGHAVVHLACHGVADPVDPLDGYLLAAGDERLTVRDLLARRFAGHPIAILSACETAVVAAELPDEVVGLPAALEAAGFAGIVGSGWSVPDAATAMLLSRFHELWAEQRDAGPAAALRRAQQWIRDTTNGEKLARFPELMDAAADAVPAPARPLWESVRGHRHPYHWAAFTYVGG